MAYFVAAHEVEINDQVPRSRRLRLESTKGEEKMTTSTNKHSIKDYLAETPANFGDWRLVSKVAKSHVDGADVEIYECEMPTKFWKLVVRPYRDSVDEVRPGFEISTGSGDALAILIGELAKQIAAGMIGVDRMIA